GLLMAILEKARTGRIILLPDDMPDGPEPCPPPCAEKFIDAVPAVKADAKAVRLQNPVQVRKCGKKLRVSAIIPDRPAASVAVIHKVRRIGNDKINNGVRQGF